MATPFPPILENQRRSIEAGGVSDAGEFIINVTWPRHLVAANFQTGGAPAVNDGQIRHIQVLIRRQLTMDSWAVQGRTVDSPDQEIIYLSVVLATRNADGVITNPGLWTIDFIGQRIRVPRASLRQLGAHGGDFNAHSSLSSLMNREGEGQTYTIQVRFGVSPRATSAADFATWRNAQVARRGFGEWSNTMRMFCYGLPINPPISFPGVTGALSLLERRRLALFPPPVIATDFLAGFDWQYNPVSNDPLSQARISYSYNVPDSPDFFVFSKNVPFESASETSAWGARGEVSLDIARLTRVTCTLRLITVNNTINDMIIRPASPIRPGTIVIEPVTPSHNTALNTEIEEPIGEEIDDGAITVRFSRPASMVGERHFFYRVNANTLEGLLFEVNTEQSFRYRDYTVEMGSEYLYIGLVNRVSGPAYANMLPLTARDPADNNRIMWRPQDFTGFGQQFNFNAHSFLTTKLQQLRLSGNVQVRNFNRVTSDQITQTIGGQFPFYSRAADFNYRVLTIGALITLHHDPTHTFLNLIRPEERAPGWWESDLRFRRGYLDLSDGSRIYNEEVVLRRDELFRGEEVIPNRRRVQDPNNDDNQSIQQNDRAFEENGMSYSPRGPSGTTPPLGPAVNTAHNLEGRNQGKRFIPGALSTFADNTGRDVSMVLDSGDNSRIIYAERKFRDVVMRWLTDGKPKLFRSETEGNMIVMLTGITFAPLRRDRLVYSFQATLTEIAEYNLRNLIMYDLIPIDFSGAFAETLEFLNNGSIDTDGILTQFNSKEYRFFETDTPAPFGPRIP